MSVDINNQHNFTELVDSSPAVGCVFGVRLSALLEMAIFFMVAILLSHFFFDGSRFIDVNPHPFWAIIILIALQYGTREALVCVFVASFVLLFNNLPDEPFANRYDYYLEVAFRPILWGIVALVIGEMRFKQKQENLALRNEILQKADENNIVLDAYQKMKLYKEDVETRLAGEMSSSIAIYEVAKTLKSLNKEEVIGAIENVVVSAISPEKFSIYMYDGRNFDINLFYGWDENDDYLSEFPADSDLAQAILSASRPICVVNEQDEISLGGQAIIAGALVDTNSGNVFGMLKIESLSFTELNMRYIETFRVLCEWIGMAYSNAGEFEKAQESSMIDSRRNLLSGGFFKRQNQFLTTLATRLDFDLSTVNVGISNINELNEEQIASSAIALGQAVEATLRTIDHVFNEQKTTTEFTILLPATNIEGAEVVIKKIKKELENLKDLSLNACYTFNTESLYQKIT